MLDGDGVRRATHAGTLRRLPDLLAAEAFLYPDHMPIAPGTRLRCAQCETEVLVVKGTEADISCCGQVLVAKEG